MIRTWQLNGKIIFENGRIVRVNNDTVDSTLDTGSDVVKEFIVRWAMVTGETVRWASVNAQVVDTDAEYKLFQAQLNAQMEQEWNSRKIST